MAYTSIVNYLLKGNNMITIRDIADRLQISQSTISKVLNGGNDVGPEVRQQVLDTAAEMGYISKLMKRQKHKRLCIFVEHILYAAPSDFGYDILLGFRQAAYRHGWNLVIVPLDAKFQEMHAYDSYVLENQFSGCFLLGLALGDPWIEALGKTTIPTVLFDNYIPDNPHVGYVGSDNNEAIDMMLQHLSALGHSRIAFLNGELSSMVCRQRQLAFTEGMAKLGLPVKNGWIANAPMHWKGGHAAAPVLLQKKPTAILCGSDLLALGAMDYCIENGINVPEDISITGFDDLPAAALSQPPLTTIRQDRRVIGQCAYHTLEGLWRQISISRTLLRTQLMARGSAQEPAQALPLHYDRSYAPQKSLPYAL